MPKYFHNLLVACDQLVNAVFTDEERYRYSCINSGEKNNSVKLTEEQVIQIKNLRGKCTRKEIAKKFNVSLACIKDIFGRKTWKFLEDNTSKTC